ncbi:MAG: rRNA maturation RNase YbeY [bacterium]|nr:rRNA maturation RNase YbeY [bacterium]
MASINVVGDFFKSGLTEAEIESAVEAVFDVLGKSKGINVAFVEAENIQKENLKYRHIDKPTDVLSFDYEDEGDILLCLEIIDKYKEGESLKEATTKTLIHGALHLFGHDHENDKDHAIMEKMAKEIFGRLK